MAIIVEDGSNVPNANSFISVAYLKDYASARNIALSDDDKKLEAALILAMDKLDTYRSKFAGKKRAGFPLYWPRDNAWVDGEEYPNDEIPYELKKAQAILATAVDGGVSLFTNTTADTQTLKREKIDVLEFEYAVPEGSDAGVVYQPIIVEAASLLASLMGNGGFNDSVNSWVVRA